MITITARTPKAASPTFTEADVNGEPREKRPYKLPAYKIMAPLAYVLAGLMVYWSGFTAVSISIAQESAPTIDKTNKGSMTSRWIISYTTCSGGNSNHNCII